MEQHKKLKEIVSGKKKIPHKRFNPKYRLANLLGCTEECLEDRNARYPCVVGYDHHNGKQGDKRKAYEKYRCRSCNKEHTRQHVHAEIDKVLELTLGQEDCPLTHWATWRIRGFRRIW